MNKEISDFVKRNKPENSNVYSLKIFRDNNLSPKPDSELTDLIAVSSQYLSDNDLARFLQFQKKFDGPATMMETGQKIEHWKLRSSLKRLPDYMKAAESAGLSYSQANELLVHMLKSEPYYFHNEDLTITLMTRAYRRVAEAGLRVSDAYDTVKDMITLGAKSGVIDGCFYSFSNLIRLGLSVEQACRTVMMIPEAEGSASGYPVPHFNDAVKSMMPAKVNPDLVVEAFEYLGGKRPWLNMGNYDGFRALMTFGCPTMGLTPNEMLSLFVTKARNGGKEIPVLEEVSKELDQHVDNKFIFNKDRYFTEVQGELEHFAQPYQNKRSLNQGIRDLEKLAVASMHEWDEVEEGMWLFDPEKGIWYSFGGQLELPGMGDVLSGRAGSVRHKFIPYDISALSQTPFLFHVHPEGLDSFVSPPENSMAYPEFRDDLTKFMTATPSRADYGVVAQLLKGSRRKVPTRSFIAHALGVTEFTYPNDVTRLEEMKEKSRDIRDQVMLWFDIGDYVAVVCELSYSRLDLVQRLMRDLDRRLPLGFNLALYPAGTNFEK
ncbi:hypothetical protein JW756_06140 [Candidatus Woesearchaeota archaeon]|nr:hypothetical protein [Candidatus Woesearchaeota archaeon]